MEPDDAIAFVVVDPRSPEATWSMTQYFDELDRRFPGGFDPGDTLTADAGALDPPTGVFLLARSGDDIVGCGGVQTIVTADAGRVAEIKRMWVSPHIRGHRVGSRLLAELEARAADIGHRVVRLDTNSDLPEAVAMYRRAGYREIGRYNDNPYPDHFFERTVDGTVQL